MPIYTSYNALDMSAIDKAFAISIAVFWTALGILILAIFANLNLTDEILNQPAYTSGSYKFTGDILKAIVALLRAIDKADFIITILSGISSLVTYIGKIISR